MKNKTFTSDSCRKALNSFLTYAGLLLLMFVFGASSNAFGQKGKSEKEKTTPQKESPAPRESNLRIDCKPVPIKDDNGDIKGIGIECKPKKD
jgi:hypothetical protein